MKRFFDRLTTLNALVFFLAMFATSVALAEALVLELGKKYKSSVFICGTRDDAELVNDHFQSRVDVARNERTKPLPAPKNVNCGSTTVTFEVIGYADKSLNGEGLDKKGNIVKDRYLIVNAVVEADEPFTLKGALIRVPIDFRIAGIDPPEKRAGQTPDSRASR